MLRFSKMLTTRLRSSVVNSFVLASARSLCRPLPTNVTPTPTRAKSATTLLASTLAMADNNNNNNSTKGVPAPRTSFHGVVKADGSSPFRPEADRYHLYVSLGCPWAHRTLVVRALKGLEHVIGMTVVDYLLEEGGWKFSDTKPKCSLDPVHGKQYLREIYMIADPEYAGRISVPVLFDKKLNTIVNNESAEIMHMFATEFNAIAKNPGLDLYPQDLCSAIDSVNEWVQPKINSGVYRCGFAKTQEEYDGAIDQLFAALDRAEDILSRQRYITGDRFTGADVRLFTSLIRFDVVYVLHFKCNLKRIQDYPNLQGYLKELYQMAPIRSTVDFEHIKKQPMMSQKELNPLGIVSRGPPLDLDSPHDRARLPSATKW